jgi:Cys-tRNA(Pro)/Cys-tRNA(Cys) deacylase
MPNGPRVSTRPGRGGGNWLCFLLPVLVGSDPSGEAIIADMKPGRVDYNAGMPTSTPATRSLDSLGIPYRLFLHSTTVRSLEQAASERGLAPGQIVRSLVFRVEKGSYVLVLVAGPAQVAWPKLRHHLGVSRLTTADKGEVIQSTGYAPGTVSPLGLTQLLPILADRGLMAYEEISVGAGIPNAGIILKRDDLLAVVHPVIGDFCD